jgi:YHS domain-containing protein
MSMNILLLASLLACQKDPASTKAAMSPIQVLVGEWRVQVAPEDSKEEAWEETQAWEYKIDKEEYALQFESKSARKFKSGILSYDLKRKLYRLEAVRADDRKAVFEGKLVGKELSLDEIADEKGPQERFLFNLLRDNRVLMSIERKEAGKNTWLSTHSYAATKQGVPFTRGEGPKCVVTGGSPAMEVQYKGATYMVCCNTCKKEFLAHPEEMIARAKKEGFVK